MKYLLIGELAKQANTTKDTIRHYDDMGLLKKRSRQAGSRQYAEYHPQCVQRIELIKVAQAVGFTLNEISESLDDYYDGRVSIAEQLQVTNQKLQQAKKQQCNLNQVIELLTERIALLESLQSNDSPYHPTHDLSNTIPKK